MASISIWAIDGMPEWEQQLWRDVVNAAVTERSEGVNDRRTPGDWIPGAHAPYELIPEPDLGPVMLLTPIPTGGEPWGKGRRRTFPPR